MGTKNLRKAISAIPTKLVSMTRDSAFKLFETKMDKKLSELGSDFHKIVKNQMNY